MQLIREGADIMRPRIYAFRYTDSSVVCNLPDGHVWRTSTSSPGAARSLGPQGVLLASEVDRADAALKQLGGRRRRAIRPARQILLLAQH